MVVMPNTLSDHPSLVGIVRFPFCNYTTQEVPVPLVIKDTEGKFLALRQIVDMATTITGVEKTSTPIEIPKSNLTDFYPYTYYVLTDGEGDPVIMQPQYMPNSLIIKGKFALSHQPVERYYPVGYKGDQDGTIYNITNLNQMMLPTATNEGINYMNANANVLLKNLFCSFELQKTPVPNRIEVNPWNCSLGTRIHTLTLDKWSADAGFKPVALPTERKMTTAEAYALPSDVEYWDAQILGSLEPGIYVLKEEKCNGDWELNPNIWSYRTWIFEVVR